MKPKTVKIKSFERATTRGWKRRLDKLNDVLERYKGMATWASLALSVTAVLTSLVVAYRATSADQRSQDGTVREYGRQIKLVMSDWNEACLQRTSGTYKSGSQSPIELNGQFPELERIGREIRVDRVDSESLRSFMRLRLLASKLAQVHTRHTEDWLAWRDSEGDKTQEPLCVYLSVFHAQLKEEVDTWIKHVGN